MSQDQSENLKPWHLFLDKIQKTPSINTDEVSKVIKMTKKQFPSDNIIQDYFLKVFSKTTRAINRKKWHTLDKQLLIWTVIKYLYSQLRNDLSPTCQDFNYISEVLGVSQELIVLKWISLLHTNLKLQPWSVEEDNLLREIAMEKHNNNNWTELTIEFNSRGQTQRYPKQIRERWNNVLNPIIQKSTWNKEEKMKLLELVYNHGKRWSRIQNYLFGRCENQIKNQYNGMMRNLKRLNLTNEEEKQVLFLVISNPEQKISAIINQYIQKLENNMNENEKKSIPSITTSNNLKMVCKNENTNGIIENIHTPTCIKDTQLVLPQQMYSLVNFQNQLPFNQFNPYFNNFVQQVPIYYNPYYMPNQYFY